jgi:hypothetical protein
VEGVLEGVTSCSLGGGGQSVHEVGKDSDVVTVGVLVHEDTHMCTAVVIVVDSETASREREPRATYPHSCCFRISKDSPPLILLLRGSSSFPPPPPPHLCPVTVVYDTRSLEGCGHVSFLLYYRL